MKLVTRILSAAAMAAFLALPAASFAGSPKGDQQAEQRVLAPASAQGADTVHGVPQLGKATPEPQRVTSSHSDTDTLAMIKNCSLAPHQKGDTLLCNSCCEKMSCCATTMK